MEKHTTVFVPINEGMMRLEADPASKKGRYMKLADGPARKVGLAILAILLVVTVSYCRDAWKNRWGAKIASLTDTSSSSLPTQTSPTSFTITHSTWSSPTSRVGPRWRMRTEPASAFLEVRNADTGETLVIDRDGIAPPAHWTKIHCRLPDKDPTQSALLIIW